MLSILLLFLIFVIVIAIAVLLIVTNGNRKLTSDVSFQNVEYTGGSVLENFYDAPIQNPTWDDVTARIRKMMDMNDYSDNRYDNGKDDYDEEYGDDYDDVYDDGDDYREDDYGRKYRRYYPTCP